MEKIMPIEQFTLTQAHIKLLKSMYVDFYDYAYDGAPAVDIKRPYGNGDVVGDIYEILYGEELPEDEYGERDYSLAEELMKLHAETGVALQICMCTLSFEPGTYRRARLYDSRSWVKVDE